MQTARFITKLSASLLHARPTKKGSGHVTQINLRIHRRDTDMLSVRTTASATPNCMRDTPR